MSYMFTNGPFTHTGIKGEYATGKYTFMVGVSNTTDFRVTPADQINKKFLIAQYSIAPTDKVKLYANYVGGKTPGTSMVSQFDLVGTVAVSGKFNIGVNGTLNNSKAWDGVKNVDAQIWYGSAMYFNYDPKSSFGLTFHSEYFNDDKRVKGLNNSIFCQYAFGQF